VKTGATAMPPADAHLLAVGLQHHQAGRLAEAEACYRRVLAAHPDHADPLHLLGIIAGQTGRHDLAVELTVGPKDRTDRMLLILGASA
jgi:Flp pilus assembly protein TadD